jgi:hypothetical protein
MTPVDLNAEFTLTEFQQMIQPLIDGTQPSLSFQTVQHHKNGKDIPVEVFLQFVHLQG